jgi:predicted alpha/beta hydrolase
MLPPQLSAYAKLCGWNLARAHARTGDAAAMAGYLGTGKSFDHAIEHFAVKYADQNEKDYGALVAAAESGRIEAEDGV